jgi:hypothetical protein
MMTFPFLLLPNILGLQERILWDRELRIVPLFAWYTPLLNPKWHEGDVDYRRGWLDFRDCIVRCLFVATIMLPR